MTTRSPRMSPTTSRSSFCTPRPRLGSVAGPCAALLLSILPVPAAEEIPPYPYQAPPWVAPIREKLNAPVNLALDGVPLRKALAKLEEATGVKIRLVTTSSEVATRPVRLPNFKDLPAHTALSLILDSVGLAHNLMRDGVDVVERSQEDSSIRKAEQIGEEIEHIRERRFPTPKTKAEQEAAKQAKDAEKEQTETSEAVKKALRSTKITRDFVDASLLDVVQAVREASKVPIMIDPGIEADRLKVTVKGGRPAEKVLEEVLRSLGLQYTLKERILFITTPEGAKNEPLAFAVWKEEQEEAERRIFRQKLKSNVRLSRVPDFVAEVARDLGLKVYPDSGAWGVDVAFTGKTAGLTVKELATILKRKGIELVVASSPHMYQQRSLPESVYRQGHKPPGLPDVDWSIYLLRRRK